MKGNQSIKLPVTGGYWQISHPGTTNTSHLKAHYTITPADGSRILSATKGGSPPLATARQAGLPLPPHLGEAP